MIQNKLIPQNLPPDKENKLSERQLKLLQANKARAEQILLNIQKSISPQVSHYEIVKKEYRNE